MIPMGKFGVGTKVGRDTPLSAANRHLVAGTFLRLNHPMSDKTKRAAEDARMFERLRQQRIRDAAKPKPDLRCKCGNTPLTPEMEIVSETQGRRVNFYCRNCAPGDFLPYFK